jgi:hypothetical protein
MPVCTSMAVSVTPAARGTIDAQRMLVDLQSGALPPGSLCDRLRLALHIEPPDYFSAMVRVLEKCVGVRA